MSTTKHHYRSDTKRGFEAGEIAGLLAQHSPNADYRVVINLRGKIRELIVEEDTAAREAVVGVLHDRDQEATCQTPVPEDARSPYFPRDFETPTPEGDHSANWHRSREGLPPAPADRGGASFRRGR